MENVSFSEKYLGKYDIDKEGFVLLGDIALGIIGRQVQYVSRFIEGIDSEYPNLGQSLRLKNVFGVNGKVTGNNYEYRIYKDDIKDFVKAVKEFYGE